MSYTGSSVVRPTSIIVHTFGPESLGPMHRQLFNASPANVAYASANRAVYIPVLIPQRATFVKAFWWNGATVAGNVDVGLYDDAWSRIASTGSTAQSGANSLQEVDITDFAVPPGRYYLAFASSDATATFSTVAAPDALRMPSIGAAQEASALPLPVTATPAVITQTIIPIYGFSRRTHL